MKRLSFNIKWIKIPLALLLVFLFLSYGQNEPVTAESRDLNKLSDSGLYARAFGYMNQVPPDTMKALMYLWAYVQRDPPMYVNNVNGHKTYIDGKINSLIYDENKPRRLINEVNSHIASCTCYPCNICENPNHIGVKMLGLTAAADVLQPPPDVVVVCQDFNYQGACYFLSVRNYNTPEEIGLPNDSISSVLVGSNVKLTLYLHGGLTGESITFYANDPNLTDNRTNNQYNWNDNATSVSVQLR